MRCPSPTASFDLVVLMHALTYAAKPAQAVAEAARVLQPRRPPVAVEPGAPRTQARWSRPTATPTSGFTEKELRRFADKAGLNVVNSGTVTRERRPPHFEVISLLGVKP